MLRARNLHKRYGSHVALKSLDLEVAAGEVYALLGPNGAGKTTTINCFLGFISPDGGEASVAGYNPAQNPEAARRALAYIPEQVNLYGTLSGMENLSYFADLGGNTWQDGQLREFLREAGLQHEAMDRPVAGYSKGMRQKVGIAIALAKNAKAILLDEPTSGLDPRASHEFSELLKQLRAKGVAILMATHDIFRALDVATRVGIMQDGELKADLNTKEIAPAELEALYLRTVQQEAVAAQA